MDSYEESIQKQTKTKESLKENIKVVLDRSAGRRKNMRSYGVTDVGRNRKTNQDYIFYSDEPVGMFPNLYIVADGMGGHNAGDYASNFSVNRFLELVQEMKDSHIVLVMREAIQRVNEELFQKAMSEEDYKGMGTTFVAAVIDGNAMYVMNIGDSRLYVAGQELVQITMDHSLVQEMIRGGGLNQEEARNHPIKNVITRAVGAEQQVTPDFFEVSLHKQEHILLCSDGLTNMVDEDEIMEIIEEEKVENQIVEKLVECANFYGGRDNISAIVVMQ